MNVLISIIIPVYNVEPFLDRCIQSIRKQTHKHLEIILINDGSSDSSGAICEKYALQDDRIKVKHIKNGGSSIARNQGLKLCKGEYIGFVDSDDWIQPNMYSDLLRFSIKNDLKVVETNSTEGHLVNINIKNIPIVGKIEDRPTALKRIINDKKFAVWRRLYHHSVLKNRFFIEGLLHQDVYYTIDILNEVSFIGYLENELYVYNVQNPTSVIRSDYSIKKLKSINAGIYVVENTSQYANNIQTVAKKYLFWFLTTHYDSLFMNPDLDKDFTKRSQIRNTIRKYHSFKNFYFYSYIILILPRPFYKIFILINKKRIKAQAAIYKILRNV